MDTVRVSTSESILPALPSLCGVTFYMCYQIIMYR